MKYEFIRYEVPKNKLKIFHRKIKNSIALEDITSVRSYIKAEDRVYNDLHIEGASVLIENYYAKRKLEASDIFIVGLPEANKKAKLKLEEITGVKLRN